MSTLFLKFKISLNMEAAAWILLDSHCFLWLPVLKGGQLRIWEYSHVVLKTMMIYQIEETDKEKDILIRMKIRKI